ncbi:serine hydrolase domain-containing protein [Brevibacillus sp. 179-C9.3 HS]|uniref:serine hydrolase domain-containing protein n=1 Tax=unclassified Brevibacillus TaxID=2684853 RepID=UPI0039A3D9DD
MQSPLFPAADPTQTRFDTELLTEFDRKIRKEKIVSCLIIQDSNLVFAYYKNKKHAQKLQKINSCTKSFISALIGIALDQGVIPSLDTPIVHYFPYLEKETVDPVKRSITLFHLLTMTPGFDWPEFGEWQSFPRMLYSPDWVRFVLDRPLLDQPGEKMNYNSGCSHLLSAILQKASGTSTYDFAQKHLFRPLNMQDSYWYSDGQGIHNGGDGLRLTSNDMAKLGFLYLQNGKWQDKQIVPAAWVQESIQPKFRTYERIGSYGLHWWSNRIDPSKDWTEDNWYYFALGFGGQYIIVVPSRDLIVVFNSEIYDHSLRPLALFRQYILAAS